MSHGSSSPSGSGSSSVLGGLESFLRANELSEAMVASLDSAIAPSPVICLLKHATMDPGSESAILICMSIAKLNKMKECCQADPSGQL